MGGKHSFLSFIREERVEDNSQVLGAWRGQYRSVRDIDHVCATVLSKIKILFFYLFSLLNREERDPTPLESPAQYPRMLPHMISLLSLVQNENALRSHGNTKRI